MIAVQFDHVSKRYRAGRSGTVIDMVAANVDRRRGRNSQGHRFLFAALATNAVLANIHLIVVGDGDLRQAPPDGSIFMADAALRASLMP